MSSVPVDDLDEVLLELEAEFASIDESKAVRYLYGFRVGNMAGRVSPDDPLYRLVKVGTTTAPDLYTCLRRLYAHQMAFSKYLGSKINIPVQATKNKDGILMPSPNAPRTKGLVSINEVSDLISHMKCANGDINDKWSDLMFLVPLADTIVEKHEVEQIETVVRHSLGATVVNLVQLIADIEAYYNLYNPAGSSSAYKLNESEFIVVSNDTFNDVQGLFMAGHLENVYKLHECMDECRLAFGDSVQIPMKWRPAGRGTKTFRIHARRPLERRCGVMYHNRKEEKEQEQKEEEEEEEEEEDEEE